MELTTPVKVATLLALVSLAFSACTKDEFPNPNSLNQNTTVSSRSGLSEDLTFYALASGTVLDKYSTADPKTILDSATTTGLQSGETILGIDFRPATGALYGVAAPAGCTLSIRKPA